MSKILSFDVNDLKGIMLALGMASDVINGQIKSQQETGLYDEFYSLLDSIKEFNKLIVRIGEFLPANVLSDEGGRVVEIAKKNIKKFEALENEISQDNN